MKRETMRLLSAALALLAVGCQPAQQAPSMNSSVTSEDTDVVSTTNDPQQLAVAARDALFKQLSTRLIEAMSSGGPAAAIEVCSHEAPKIAASVGENHGVAIGRTSFKLRNPKMHRRNGRFR